MTIRPSIKSPGKTAFGDFFVKFVVAQKLTIVNFCAGGFSVDKVAISSKLTYQNYKIKKYGK